MNAPAATPTPIGETDPRSGWPMNVPAASSGKNTAQVIASISICARSPGAAPIRDEHAPRRREAERGVIEHHAGAGADEEERRLPPADRGVEIPRGQHDQDRRDRRRPGHERARLDGDGIGLG